MSHLPDPEASPAAQLWVGLLSEADQARIARARFARRVGMGERPAVIVIDVQNYMIGPPSGAADEDYPAACGPSGPAAVERIARLLDAARSVRVPVVYTRFELRRDGSDIGVYGRKRDLLPVGGWCLEGTRGTEIVPALAPHDEDTVLVKKKPSAFFGTPLLSLLIAREVDTLIVTGGSTSNCVRATVVDSASYNFRTLVAYDCVFDRFEICHRVALFDMDRQYADVVDSRTVLALLTAVPRATRSRR